MYAITELRNQHDAAMSMADRLIDLIDDYRCETDALPIALQFNKLVGLLRVISNLNMHAHPQVVPVPNFPQFNGSGVPGKGTDVGAATKELRQLTTEEIASLISATKLQRSGPSNHE